MEYPLWNIISIKNTLKIIKFKQPTVCNVATDKMPHNVASFDLDGTIIKTKSGEKFARDHKDWEFLYDIVPNLLRNLHKDKYEVVIFTNQKGIARNPYILNSFKRKLYDICVQLDVPLTVFVSLMDDNNRKPSIGMWHQLMEDIGDIDKSQSYFVGDAAGRRATPIKPRDFSDSDKRFANAIGITFYTPEKYFLNKKDTQPKNISYYFTRASAEKTKPLPEKEEIKE